MKTPLTKSDLCWVLVKLAGVYLVYCAVAAIIALFSTSWGMSDLAKSLPRDYSLGSMFLKTTIFSCALPFCFGIYLINSGWFVHRLLMSVPVGSLPPVAVSDLQRPSAPPTPTPPVEEEPFEEPIPGINLSGRELARFKLWLATNPEMQNRARIDQVALFRDAQRAGKVPPLP